MKILTAPQSGSQAGTTASRNRFGQYLRSRAVPVQPRTPKQTYTRSLFTAGSSAWRGLSVADQTAWNDYAAQIQRSDSLGSSYAPTGAGLFTAAAVLARDPSLTSPPPELPSYLLTVTGITYIDPTPGPEALNIAFPLTSAHNLFLVETSGPVSPGITSAAAVRSWRSLPTTAGNLVGNQFSMNATPVDAIDNYKFLFPSPATGQVIWFRFSEIFQGTSGSAGVINRLKQTLRFVVP